MISIIVTTFIIVALSAIMEIAATALKLTGINLHIARFQALSALTGTGFTTREAESIMEHRQRRIIIMILMIVGPIGFLTILGSVLVSIREDIFLYELLSILVVIFIILRIFKSKFIGSIFHKIVERQIKKRRLFRKVILEEVLTLDENLGVCEFIVTENSKVVEKKLLDTNFKNEGFIVLAIERGDGVLSAPKGSETIQKGDRLVVFGNVKNMKQELIG
ncbi:MAG: TrkA C-terminal domain-containing protein [Candidatus Omnitrophica bacterium]|nr:TrkA C-terminal domain-containing protein [Candidatus Omnitrophota bacterium]